MNSHHLRVRPARQDRPRLVPLRVRLALLLGEVAALAAATPTAFYAPLWQAGLWALCAFTVALLVGLVAARCVSEPLLALARNVSARHTVEAALRASEAQYRSVVESVREIVFQVDADGSWTFLNPAWTALTEYTVEETLGRPFINFVHPDDRARIREAFNARISKQAPPGRTEVRYQTRSGGTRWMEGLSSVMRGPDGQVRGLSGTLMDVTERRHAEAARVRMLIREQEARDHQERAAEVTGIVQSVELARRVVREARQVIAGLRPTVLDDFGLERALRLHVQELAGEGWTIEYDAQLGSGRLPGPIETVLYRIAQEALTNVRKHAQTLAATVCLRRYDGHVELDVVDRGVGFRQFAGRDDARPGQQIGLVGMRERAALVGRLCLVQSQPGEGTRVSVRIPLHDEPGEEGVFVAPVDVFRHAS